MGAHLIDGQFQSDKYPTTPRGFFPMKLTDKRLQDLIWEAAQRYREVDPELADDLETALKLAGHDPTDTIIVCIRSSTVGTLGQGDVLPLVSALTWIVDKCDNAGKGGLSHLGRGDVVDAIAYVARTALRQAIGK